MGDVAAWAEQKPPAPPTIPSDKRFRPLTATMLKWFGKRGISEATLARNRVQYEVRQCMACYVDVFYLRVWVRGNPLNGHCVLLHRNAAI